jgi:Uma2 family endonuclease
MSDDQFFDFCQANREWRMERTAEGDILVMSPSGSETSRRNAYLTAKLFSWAEQDRSGVAYDSSAGFRLPDRATLSPDASWVSKAKLSNVSAEERKKFPSLCPDFVVELRSPTDRLSDLKDKMQQYIDNGARLGWLIDPESDPHRVYVYRPGQAVDELIKPEHVSAEPELPGFLLEPTYFWNPGW